MYKRVIKCEKNNCTMCKACEYVCPNGAIEFLYEDEFFEHYAAKNMEKCIECGFCEANCPVNVYKENEPNYKVYMGYANDEIRIGSSSGGIFPLLAMFFLDSGGIVVGAELVNGTNVIHKSITEKTDLKKLCGSKYFRSDMSFAYREIRDALENGKKILFCGTPCQVYAVKTLFSTYDSLLYTIDLLCKGVPKDFIVKQYLESIGGSDSIKSIKFRDKERFGWSGSNAVFVFDSHEYIAEYWENDMFQRLYHDSVALRESCLDCRFANCQRCGDISLGDMWDYDKVDDQITNDSIGMSKIFVNTSKGHELFSCIREQLKECREIELKENFINRIHSKLKHDEVKRHRFYELMRTEQDLKMVYNRVENKKYDIGLFGCWSIENHGSNMTYYALYKCLIDMGYDVLMIERPNSSIWKPHNEPDGFLKNPYPDYALAPLFADKSEMKQLNDMCDVFLLGSDQLLYHDLYKSFDEFIDMRYIHDDKRKVAYATSLGRKYFEGTEKQRKTLGHFLQKFDAISVREKNTIDAIDKMFGINAVWMPDPVFLLNKEQYVEYMNLQEIKKTDEEYIAAYILDPTEKKANILNDFAKKSGYRIKVYSDVAYSSNDEAVSKFGYDTISTNEEWLNGIKNSSIFVTDSFHGTCFAIIFNVPFVCIANKRRGYERFTSLLEHFDLMECLIDDLDSIASFDVLQIDYDRINRIIEADMNNAKKWLRENLVPNEGFYSDYDILDNRIDEMYNEINKEVLANTNRSLSSEQWLANTHNRVGQLEKTIDILNKAVIELQEVVQEENKAVIELQKNIQSTPLVIIKKLFKRGYTLLQNMLDRIRRKK